jgi:hypothetical protein
MTRRDWWLGVSLVAMAVGLHAAYPRYDWRPTSNPGATIRIDRWTGEAVLGRHNAESNGRWQPVTLRDATVPKQSGARVWFGEGEINWPKTLLLVGGVALALLLVVWASLPYFRRGQPHEPRHDDSGQPVTGAEQAAAARSPLISPVTGWTLPDQPLHPQPPNLVAKMQELKDQLAERVREGNKTPANSQRRNQTQK